MKLRFAFLFILSLLGSAKTMCQSYDSKEIIAKAIDFHDPSNQWHLFDDTLQIRQNTANDTYKFRVVVFDNLEKHFQFTAKYEDGQLQYTVNDQVAELSWNNSQVIDNSLIEKYNISKDRALMYRDYYSYLYGMPMKLRDPGTIIDPKATLSNYHGHECYQVSVSYIPEVGQDHWYFYFDADDFHLVGYQFYRDEISDGEYIKFDGLKELNGIKFPRKMNWFMTRDDQFLGADEIIN